MRCIPKSLLDDIMSISILEGCMGKLVKMLLGISVHGVITSSTPGKLAIQYLIVHLLIHTHQA